MDQITLYYRAGSSDKVYQASITPQDGGFTVQFAYGRRGATLQTGTKTQAPVPYEEAKKIFDRLVAEKTAKGYIPGESGVPYQNTDKAEQVSGILPQLLNPIETAEAIRLVTNAAWLVQEKFDGKRTLIRKSGSEIAGINRQGLIVALPKNLVEAAARIHGPYVIDGECIGERYFAFDLLEFGGTDLRELSYRDRLAALVQLVFGHDAITCAETASDTAHKAEMLERLRRRNREGAVFKRADAPYVPGRPASGGNALKVKFCTTASFVVAKVNAKRSVSLHLLDRDRWVDAGNVTIPPNHEIPAVGWTVECRYLYAFPESNRIYQPVYLGPREDIPPEECIVSQLKFKATAAAA